jgi:hypothetical protein
MAFDAAAEVGGRGVVVAPNPLANVTGVSALSLKVQSLRRGIAAIQESTSKIGTDLDVVAIRRKLVGQISKAVALTDEIEAGLRRATVAASGSRDLDLQRSIKQLSAQFDADKTALVAAVRTSQRLQHEYEPIDLHASAEWPENAAEGNAGRQSSAIASKKQQQEVVIEMKNFGAVEAAIIEVWGCTLVSAFFTRRHWLSCCVLFVQERLAEAQAIAQESIELHGMFKDLAVLVNEQSKQLDEVESNVDEAHSSVVAANKELTTAAKYQASYRKKICCVLFLIILVALIVIIPIVITQAPKWHI